jgi:LAO/AO transport system kinase
VASQGQGIEEIVAAVDAHRGWLGSSGTLATRRRLRALEEIEAIALETLRGRMGDLRGGTAIADLADLVVGGALDSYTAADRLVAGLSGG